MKKYAMIAVFAAMCIGVAGCSDTDTESSVELTEILENEETGTEDAGAENNSEEVAEENSEDAYVGTYFCEDTATTLTVTTSENEGYDYTFTWGDAYNSEVVQNQRLDGVFMKEAQ